MVRFPIHGMKPFALTVALLIPASASLGQERLAELNPATDVEMEVDSSGAIEMIKERYPNGAIKIEREVTRDASDNYHNHGSWKAFNESGTVVAQGQYVNGQRDGLWTRWYRGAEIELLKAVPYTQFTGPYISQATFENGRLHGAWTIYDAKQQVITKWEFSQGLRHGTWTWNYANGHKMREITFVDGEMDGHMTEWLADGALARDDIYQMGRKLAPKVTYHEGTKVKKTEGMYLFAKDVEVSADDWWTGTLARYQKQGIDEKHGAWAQWYTNGALEMKGQYDHNVETGAITWWHSNGQKMLESHYENGERTGRWVWWHSNGQKSAEGNYTAGAPDSRWTYWAPDGRVSQRADYSHGQGAVAERPDAADAAAPRTSSTPLPLNR